MNKIRVIVRIRPFIDEEIKGNDEITGANCLKIRGDHNEIELVTYL